MPGSRLGRAVPRLSHTHGHSGTAQPLSCPQGPPGSSWAPQPHSAVQIHSLSTNAIPGTTPSAGNKWINKTPLPLRHLMSSRDYPGKGPTGPQGRWQRAQPRPPAARARPILPTQTFSPTSGDKSPGRPQTGFPQTHGPPLQPPGHSSRCTIHTCA